MSRWSPETIEERLRAKVRIDAAECWVWVGSTDSRGYGQLRINDAPQKAHRVAYELFVGPIPEGLHLDHLCRVRLCVNPGHLEPVTVAENNRRSREAVGHANARKTHCPQGHAYDHVTSTGARACRPCRREANRRYRWRQHV